MKTRNSLYSSEMKISVPHGFVYVAAGAAVPRRIVNDEVIAD